MIKEIPILYSTPMVKAILDDRKTMTRRVVKPMNGLQATWLTQELLNSVPSCRMARSHEGDGYGDLGVQLDHPKGGPLGWVRCPYGKPGDLLWVRECWQESYNEKLDRWVPIYKADGILYFDDEGLTKWKPSIHMKKKYARIWLEVVRVKVQRLHDISPSDACAEGIEYQNVDLDAFEGGELQADFKNYMWRDDESYEDYHFPYYANCISSFFSLWESINGKDLLESNPWVWAIKFKVLSTTGKP